MGKSALALMNDANEAAERLDSVNWTRIVSQLEDIPANAVEIIDRLVRACELCKGCFESGPCGSRTDAERMEEWSEWINDDLHPAVCAAIKFAKGEKDG